MASIGTAQAQGLPFGISLPPSLNFATSPSPVGAGARAVGKGTAFIAVADDATAASHNPAGLFQLQRPEVSIVGSFYQRFEQQDVTRPATSVPGQTLRSADLNYLSAALPFEIFRRNVVVSLNVQRLFDLRGATDVTSRYTTIDGTQHVQSRQTGGLLTISPAAAVQITSAFSIGAALNIWPDLFGNGWQQDVTVRGQGRVVSGPDVVSFVSTGRIKEDFGFRGVNVTAGFHWEILPDFLWLGGVVRTPFRATVPHTNDSTLTVALQDGSVPVTSHLTFRETLHMDLPVSYGLGVAIRPLPEVLTLALDVSRTHWSAFRLTQSTRGDVLLVDNGAPSGKGRAVLNGEGGDTTSVRLGAEYVVRRPHVKIPLRAGFFYDPEPGAGGLDQFFGFSLGTGIAVGPCIADVAYTFRTGVVSSAATDTTVSQHTILSSIIYHF